MQTRKVVLVFLAVASVYIVAAGGITRLLESPEGLLAALFSPLMEIRPFDAGLLMVAIVMLTWAMMLGEAGRGITRENLLMGVTLGSALLTTGFLAFMFLPQNPDPEMVGVLALMSVLQGFVGFTAATLLLCRKESRGLSPMPLLLNGALTTLAVLMVCTPFITAEG